MFSAAVYEVLCREWGKLFAPREAQKENTPETLTTAASSTPNSPGRWGWRA